MCNGGNQVGQQLPSHISGCEKHIAVSRYSKLSLNEVRWDWSLPSIVDNFGILNHGFNIPNRSFLQLLVNYLPNTQRLFSAQEIHNLIDWLAEYHPKAKGRQGIQIWQGLVTDIVCNSHFAWFYCSKLWARFEKRCAWRQQKNPSFWMPLLLSRMLLTVDILEYAPMEQRTYISRMAP